MKLAVFRAEADGRRTTAALIQRGHDAVLAPVIRIVLTGASVDVSRIDALVFTSQHAIEALGSWDRSRKRGIPCFCVGSRTAAAARSAGFTQVHQGGSDAAALAVTIAERCAPGASITFVAGRDRKPGLETDLVRRGFPVTVVEAYAAESIDAWPPKTIASLTDCDGALHFSARTAELACICCETAGFSARLRGWTHYCLSADVAGPLRARALPIVKIAPTPSEAALLALLKDEPRLTPP